jgi:hypothetical protein
MHAPSHSPPRHVQFTRAMAASLASRGAPPLPRVPRIPLPLPLRRTQRVVRRAWTGTQHHRPHHLNGYGA